MKAALALRPLAALPGVRLINLQTGDGREELDDLPPGMAVEQLGEDFDAGPDAFLDAAAVMESLDLVITTDTALAHLAAALGRPTWVALKFSPDWRWLLGRDDTPWYPSMRLFRQETVDDWSEVFPAMRRALRRQRARQRSTSMSRAKTRCLASCFRAISRRRSSVVFSRTRHPSRARACRRWTTQRATPAT